MGKISASADGGPSKGSRVHGTGSETPIGASGHFPARVSAVDSTKFPHFPAKIGLNGGIEGIPKIFFSLDS